MCVCVYMSLQQIFCLILRENKPLAFCGLRPSSLDNRFRFQTSYGCILKEKNEVYSYNVLHFNMNPLAKNK